MRTPQQLVDDIIRLHTDDPTTVEWEARRKLMTVAVIEALMDREAELQRSAEGHLKG